MALIVFTDIYCYSFEEYNKENPSISRLDECIDFLVDLHDKPGSFEATNLAHARDMEITTRADGIVDYC